MKLFKKTAALLFCLALVFSVMAISASAADPGFSLALAQSSSDTHTQVTSTADNAFDYKTGDTVVYDILLSKTDSGTYDVNAIEFTLNYDANNFSAATVAIGSLQESVSNGGTVYYLAENYATADDYLPTDGTTPIGTVTLTTAATITPTNEGDPSVVAEFSVSDATAHYAANTQSASVDTTSDDASASVEIHKNYTITMMRPEFDSDTGVKQNNFETIKDNGTAITYTYNIVDAGVNGNSAAIPADEQAYYDFTGWSVEPTAANDTFYNWESSLVAATTDGFSSGAYTVPAGKFGDVTLTSTFKSATYYVTYAQGTGGSSEATNTQLTAGSGDNAGKYAYTIDNAQADFGAPTRPGYDFKGWKASGFATTTNWQDTDDENNDVLYAVPGETANIVNMYGNVTLTPTWEAHTFNATFTPGSTDQTTTVTFTTTTAQYTIENYSNLATITISRVGYDFTGWKVTSASDNVVNSITGWAANDMISAESGDGADHVDVTSISGKYGTVTFEAQWTPHVYTATLNKGVTNSANESDADVTLAASANYTIEDVDALSALEPTRKGYTFNGWKVTGAGSTPTSWTAWNGTTETTIYKSGSVFTNGTDFAVANYGDIGLTAQWKIDGSFTLKNYNFAYRTSRASGGSGDALLLFATNSTDKGTYKINGNVMYDVTSKYGDLFTETTVYAYIASDSLTLADVTFIGGAEKGNETVTYNGDVNANDGTVDVGDYGTAGTVFRDPTAYQSDLSVLQRLKMNDSSTISGDWIGSINDLAAIITKAGG